ncbi:MAG: phosphatase PAP2 family protein [Bdellovibrio sp.]
MPIPQIGELLANPQKLTWHILRVIIASLVLSLLAAFFLDQSFSAYFSQPEIRDLYRPTARILTDFGLSEYYFLLAITTWAFAKWVTPKKDFARRWGLNLLVALLVCGAITHIIKFLVGRQRPHKSPDFDPWVFTPFTTHWHWHSFSSGHSQVIFTAATMMSLAFPKWRWLWIFFAISICLTRVIVHDHFFSDTIFGACVGYVGTLMALYLMRAKTRNGLY